MGIIAIQNESRLIEIESRGISCHRMVEVYRTKPWPKEEPEDLIAWVDNECFEDYSNGRDTSWAVVEEGYDINDWGTSKWKEPLYVTWSNHYRTEAEKDAAAIR